MNTRLFFASCLYILSASVFSQTTVWIADNNFNAPTGDHIFPTLQEAVDAAKKGDSVYVQPSNTTYGDAYIDKELHLFGIGFDLDKDAPLNSKVRDIFLRNNVDGTSESDSSTITGLVIDDILFITFPSAPLFTLEGVAIYNNQINQIEYTGVGTYVPIDSMVIAGNRIAGITFDRQVTDVLIRNNLITSNIDFRSTSTNTGIITNNIIYGAIDKSSVNAGMIIQNNNFIGGASSFSFQSIMRDALISNNIFYGRTPSLSGAGGSTSTNFQGNTFSNNLTNNTGNDELPPSGGGAGNDGDGNIVNGSPVFVNVAISNSWSSTYDFTLSTTPSDSPAIDGGTDGSDIGITGGPFPWTETNFSLKTTAFPTIQTFNVNTIINPGDDLDARIEVKAN